MRRDLEYLPVIGLYCPDVPPVPGGVSDHTLVLARALESRGAPPAVLARRGDPARFAPLQCVTGLVPGDLLTQAARLGLHAVLVQYVPFLFARFGVSPALWRAADTLVHAGVGLGVILHEPFVPFTRWPWLLTGWPQRWQLRHLVRRAQRVYTPVPRFAEIARRFAAPGARIAVLPVGANHPVSSATRAEARRELGIPDDRVVIGVFSPAASGFLVPWIAAAAQRLRSHPDVVWLLFGHGSHDGTLGLPAGDQARVLGALGQERLGLAMRVLDVAAQPYSDGLTMRRTSAMLVLAHGVATVSSTGHLMDPACASVAACEGSAEAFGARLEQLVADPASRALWAARAAGARHLWSVDPLADAIVSDFAPARVVAATPAPAPAPSPSPARDR